MTVEHNPEDIETLEALLALQAALADGRQSDPAREIQRGVGRLMRTLGHAHIMELTLANGRRADVVALTTAGEIWIIEIKSSVEDFRADHKWPEYWDYADVVLFAVAPGFPVDILPEGAGLILADRYGGELVRLPAEQRLAPARRRAMLLNFARTAALRLASAIDPSLTRGIG